MAEASSKKRRDKTAAARPGRPPRPGEITDKPKNARRTFWRLMGYIRPQLKLIVFVIVCVVIQTGFDVFAPKKLGEATTAIYDGVVSAAAGGPGIDFSLIAQTLFVVFVIYACSAFFSYLQMFVMARAVQNIVYCLRQDTEAKLNRLPLRYYDTHPKGDTLSRVVNDVDLISTTLQDSITQGINAFISLIGILAMMLIISPMMMLIALLTLPFSIVATVIVARRTQKLYLAQQTSLGVLDTHIEETYAGHVEVKAFVHEDEAISEFENVNSTYFNHAWRAQFFSGLVRPLTQFIGNAGYVGVAAFGALQVIYGTITVGDVQAFLQYMRSFTRPIAILGGLMSTIQGALAGAERVFELMDEPEMDDDSSLPKSDVTIKGCVEFDHVRFGYDASQQIIKDFSLCVNPGQIVAIVGPTGAGKTTLVNLLMRFYDIDAGCIRVDGFDTYKISRHELRAHFGMVLQDTWLFAGSIRDNIAYGASANHARPNQMLQAVDTTASDADIVKVAKAAHADHFIRTLPDGYDTLVNEEASNISVGQRQLITIARALLADPEILILDEATSSIDTRTERQVQDAMSHLMAGRTCFVIAHRLSTVRQADTILVLDEGDIVEQGNHDELLAAGGAYAELYNAQFQ